MPILDSDASVPLYQQLKDLIKEDIRSGRYRKNEKMPTEQELCAAYQVSRITVRKALGELTEENLLIRRPGKGTFVSTERLSRSISGIQSFTQVCHAAGKKPGARLVRAVLLKASDKDMENLGLSSQDQVVVIERVRYADGEPVSFEVNHLPSRFAYLLDENLDDISMFQLLKDKYQTEFVNPLKTIQLVYASSETARHLSVPKHHPLIAIHAISQDASQKPAHFSIQYIVGDKFTFTV